MKNLIKSLVFTFTQAFVSTAIILVLMLLAMSSNAQTSSTITTVVEVEELLLLDIKGKIVYKTTSGSRMIVETVITTNMPVHIHNAIKYRWSYRTTTDRSNNTVKLEFQTSNRVPTFKGTDLEESFVTTIYIPKMVEEYRSI